MGGLNLTTPEAAAGVLAGKLLARVEKGEMPPGAPLPAAEREALRQWVAAGAPWKEAVKVAVRPRAGRDWWSLQPLRTTEGSIDGFIEAALAAKGLRRNPPADRRTLIRRVTFDLTGLPPTPAEVDAFVNDPAPDAYPKLVDRLLASPAYGERWGRHWLDVVRFGESHGYEQNHVRPHAWRYRDFVIAAFNRDMPYDEFVRYQLAGDQLAPDDPLLSAATGFLVAGPHDTVGNSNLAAMRQQRADDLDDMVNATASAFLGLTVNCARCHDHKFDPIRQEDYYRLAAAFAGVQHADRAVATAAERAAYVARTEPLDAQLRQISERLAELEKRTQSLREATTVALKARLRPPVSPFGTEERFPVTRVRRLRMEAPAGFPGGLDEVEVFGPNGENLARQARLSVSSTRVAEGNPTAYEARRLNDGVYDQRWFPEGNQAAWIEFVWDQPQSIARVVWSTDRLKAFQGKFQQNTVSQYRLTASTDGQQWTTVATHEGRLPHRPAELERLITLESLGPEERAEYLRLEEQRSTTEAARKQVPPLPLAYAGTFRQPEEPVFLLTGGNVMQRQRPVAPASLSTVPVASFELPVDAPEASRRLELAQWITNRANPLTPRVIVNRLWHYHFGRGLVGTPSDFGFNGEKPTHPELLDHLAQRLLHHNWRLKPLHREILLSATYQQASTHQPAAARVDAEARLLWRFPPQRLSAEALRDSMLAVAGVLRNEANGPSFRLYQYTVDNVATYFPLDRMGPETYRRSVYAESARSIRTELLSVFDCPDSALPEPRRVSTTSPLQALSLLNHSFTLDMAAELEKRLTTDRVAQAFRLAYGRSPAAEEAAAAEQLIATHGFVAFARALFNSSEFLYVH